MLTKIFNHFRLTWKLLWDKEVNIFLKFFMIGAPLIYTLIPLPDDVLPVVGALDDAAFLGVGTLIFTSLCPPSRVSFHTRSLNGGSEGAMDLDQYRHPDETRNLAISFALIFGIMAIGGWLAGLVGLGLLGLGYLANHLARGQMLGNAIQVSRQQFGEIYSTLEDAQKDLPFVQVNLFITQRPEMNAYTFGYEAPYTIVLTSALVEKLTADEIRGVIGHELGHILLGHIRLTSLLSGLGGIFSLLFYSFSRSAEYSADAIALKACGGDPKTFISALIKISSGLPTMSVDLEAFLNQDQSGSQSTKAAELASTHPFITNRIRRIVELSRLPSQAPIDPNPALV